MDYEKLFKQSLIDREDIFDKMFSFIYNMTYDIPNSTIVKTDDDTWFLKDVGTVRCCMDCSKWVLGGPTRCLRCVDKIK